MTPRFVVFTIIDTIAYHSRRSTPGLSVIKFRVFLTNNPSHKSTPRKRLLFISTIEMVAQPTYTTTTRRQNGRKRRGIRSRRVIHNDNESNSGNTTQLSSSIPHSTGYQKLQLQKEAQTRLDRLLLKQDEWILFGGDRDDDRNLCLAMLDVIIRLFGDIDYMDA
jgi:hypothetical protein